MNEEKFSALLGLIVPQVVALIAKQYAYEETTATAVFYNSQVYAALEEEETKVWHFSPLTLFHMFDEEKNTGSFTFPEET